jgi:hypothetical protein
MKTALFTASFNRPDIFLEVLKGLEQNIDDLENIDVFHYIDGGAGSKQKEIAAHIEASKLPCAGIVLREENYGVGRNLIGARRDLFDNKGYERIILVEEDLIPGPNFIKTTLHLANWAKQYDDVGMVQAWNLPKEKMTGDHLDLVEPSHTHFVTYCLDVDVWDEIKETLYEYENKYLTGVSYQNKKWRAIRKKFMKPRYFTERHIRKGSLLLPKDYVHPPPFGPKLKRTVPTGQDAITSLALWEKGFVRIVTLAPRALLKGEYGVHCNPEIFDSLGLNNQGEYVWQQPVPTKFNLASKR